MAGAAMALGTLVLCLGLAVKVIHDTGWALVAAGVVTVVVGSAAAQLDQQRERSKV